VKLVSVHEAKSQLSALLAEIERTGDEVVICRRRKPVASLVPYRKRTRLDPHPLAKDVVVNYDPTEPLSADEWPSGDQEE
jgi:prevent-host-death family protein